MDCSSYFWRGWLFSLSMQKIEVVGTPAKRSDAPICIVNHTSFLDIFIMYSFKRFMFIGKKEVTKIPFGREIIRAGQTLLFDRTNKASAALMKEKILKRATDQFQGNGKKGLMEYTHTHSTVFRFYDRLLIYIYSFLFILT